MVVGSWGGPGLGLGVIVAMLSLLDLSVVGLISRSASLMSELAAGVTVVSGRGRGAGVGEGSGAGMARGSLSLDNNGIAVIASAGACLA